VLVNVGFCLESKQQVPPKDDEDFFHPWNVFRRKEFCILFTCLSKSISFVLFFTQSFEFLIFRHCSLIGVLQLV